MERTAERETGFERFPRDSSRKLFIKVSSTEGNRISTGSGFNSSPREQWMDPRAVENTGIEGKVFSLEDTPSRWTAPPREDVLDYPSLNAYRRNDRDKRA